MKRLFTAAIAAMIALGLSADMAFTYPALPDGALPDSEVTTNIALRANVERLRVFSLEIEAENIASNEVLVAVGCDFDEDGDLSFEETAFVFGYDCGVRYFANYLTGEACECTGSSISIARNRFGPSWNLAKVVKRGTGEVGETITQTLDNLKFTIKLR